MIARRLGLPLVLLGAVLLAGCFPLPLGCSSTWFRSCGPDRAEVAPPVPLSAAGQDEGQEFTFSWVVRPQTPEEGGPAKGVLLVTVKGLPAGRWLVQARRPGGWVVGEMEITVPSDHGLTEIEIWPLAHLKSIAADAYPVFQRAAGPTGRSSLLTGAGYSGPALLFFPFGLVAT